MNKKLSLLLMLCNSLLIGCPTCIGDLQDDTPLFFSDEFYQAPKKHEADDTQACAESNKMEKSEEIS